MTMDTILELKPEIVLAILRVVDRHMDFAGEHIGHNTDYNVPAMLTLLVTHFQLKVSDLYMQVTVNLIKETMDFVAELDKITITEGSKLAVDIMRLSIPLRAPHAPSPAGGGGGGKGGGRGGGKPKPAQAATSTRTTTQGQICGFFQAKRGCISKTCTRDHREPTTDSEKADVDNFFATRPKLSRKV